GIHVVICSEVGNNFYAHATGCTGDHGNFLISRHVRSTLFSHAFYPSGALVQRVECLLEIGQEILDFFDANGNAHQIRRWHQLGAFRRHVRHLLWVLNQRFHSTERFSQTHQAGVQTRLTSMVFLVETHRHHATKATHLLHGNVMAWMIWQAWVEYFLDLWTRLQVLGNLLRVAAVAIHAYCQGLDTAGGEVGIERRRHCAYATLEVQETLIYLGIIGYHSATEDIGVSAEVLRGGVQDVICAQGQWVLQVRGREGVIDDDLCVLLNGHNTCDIGNRQRRVGGGL